MTRGQDGGTPYSATANHSTSAVATQTGVTNVRTFITDITGSSDKAGAKILVKNGTTVIWQDRIGNTGAYEHVFSTPLNGTTGADVSVTVDGTAECNANVAGYTL